MEEQHRQLRLFLTKFAGSVLGKADSELNIKCFRKRQIVSITDNYNTIPGKGGFSIVYKGRLDDGRPVAVKKYIFTANKKEFTKEVIIQSQFSHKNIVRLLGCCIEADAPMLVTEFVPNGNLSDLLHGKNTSQQIPLSLNRRLKIATEVAEALVYMHTSQSHPILHGDIKPENILLDNKYMPKLSDFGISRLLSMGSDEYTGYVIGSMGYIDPMFCQTGCLTTKSDVYSFGVVLLELITRKKAIDNNKNFLAKSFGHAKTHDSFDKEIASSENIKVLDGIVKLALECLKFELEERPKMKDVSKCLRKLQREQDEKLMMIRLKSFLKESGFTRFITDEQIYKVTSYFKNIPTECFMGKLYKGDMNGMPFVAIKMSFEVHDESMEEFSRQMVLQSKIDHENVIRFQGCWLDHRITHGDVRTSNILVGDIPQGIFLKNVPIKISSIGASVYFSMKKSAQERFETEENNGYMDPKFPESGVLTKEADIYSMGVVLLELFTWKKVPNNHIRNCGLEKLLDVKFCRHLKNLAKVISECLNEDAEKRPTLKSAIRLFKCDVEAIQYDRLDANFCGNSCAARISQ
ncbi:unnamed protein product [Miscanthus lutarioriparius]|uniref:Protein kinase domain-containing protein n=1 Tax=Miscanthus lutarioriparius TaxID=422564 RepID=A0A811RF53_9POAL|nr:unnamed protein product [Miscanthus lutarioriparius]